MTTVGTQFAHCLSLFRPPLNPAGQTQEKYGMEKPTNLITPLHFLFFKQNLTSCPIAKCEGQQLKSPNVVVVVV
jgi:hypothetical protein